jgi:hypothetical protein
VTVTRESSGKIADSGAPEPLAASLICVRTGASRRVVVAGGRVAFRLRQFFAALLPSSHGLLLV